jgi:hypothetical protein
LLHYRTALMHRFTETLSATPASPACLELRRRLGDLQIRRAPADPTARAIRIGIEDEQGGLMHVVETTRLVEAVKVFELLGELGWQPREGRARGSDGRLLTRSYCRR